MHDAYKSPQPQRLFPEKLFYKIGEVSRLVGVESYVLRYWETEFPFLNPRKGKSGQRIYTKNEIDLIEQIKRLLYEEKYTIDGVRNKLSQTDEQPRIEIAVIENAVELKENTKESAMDAREALNMVKSKLRFLLQQYFGA